MGGRLIRAMGKEGAHPDRIVAAIAARQHGVVSIHQLRDAGLSDGAVLGRVRAGRLHRLHRGVYAVGHPGPSNEKRWMAAVLAFPPGAVLSHRSAASLWGLLPPAPGPVDVLLSARGGRRRRGGIRVHRSTSLRSQMTTVRRGIPATIPSRTLADLRRTASPRELRRAARQAEALGLPVGGEVECDHTRSELEHLFLRLLRRSLLPIPEVNARVDVFTVDFLWRAERLIVETDGYRYHRGRVAFEDDRHRDLALQALGFRVLRLTFRQVTEEPQRIAAVLTTLLESKALFE